MEIAAEPKKPEHKPDHTITVVISTPDEDEEFTFDKTTKISEVITVAVTKFGLDPNDAYELALADKPTEKLSKDRPLNSFKEIKDGTKLILSSRAVVCRVWCVARNRQV